MLMLIWIYIPSLNVNANLDIINHHHNNALNALTHVKLVLELEHIVYHALDKTNFCKITNVDVWMVMLKLILNVNCVYYLALHAQGLLHYVQHASILFNN